MGENTSVVPHAQEMKNEWKQAEGSRWSSWLYPGKGGDLGHPGGRTHLQGFLGASAGHPKAEAGLRGTAPLDNFSFTCMDMNQAFPERE